MFCIGLLKNTVLQLGPIAYLDSGPELHVRLIKRESGKFIGKRHSEITSQNERFSHRKGYRCSRCNCSGLRTTSGNLSETLSSSVPVPHDHGKMPQTKI